MKKRLRKPQLFITKPVLPSLSSFQKHCSEIWKSGVVTNNGPKVKYLEKLLADHLEVNCVSLVSSGTLGLIIASKVLGGRYGRCVTTPYSFCASAASPRWAGLDVSFVDVERNSPNISPAELENHFRQSRKKSLIIAVHCYGFPCDISALDELSTANYSPLIYDASHAFGVSLTGQSLLSYGEASVASLHATKTFTTVEGGLVATKDRAIKEEIDWVRNFGFDGEDNIVRDGMNAKMSELHAAIGIENLKSFQKNIIKRSKICAHYDLFFQNNFPQIETFQRARPEEWNFGYYPILLREFDRDFVWLELKRHGVFSRRYFYPLLSDLQLGIHQGKSLSSSSAFPRARLLANSVLCLPIYPQMKANELKYICEILKQSLEKAFSRE